MCYHRNNKWTKRGVAIIPTMYGIAFGVDFLNQGGALVHVYKDGSVLLTHGGIEMGQVGIGTIHHSLAPPLLTTPTGSPYQDDPSVCQVSGNSP